MAVFEELQQMTDERFLAIYEALAQQGFGPLDAEVAKQLKFRPQAIRKLPMPKRAKRARMLLERNHNTELAYELFGSYLIATNKGIITDFLDATGVEHEEGMIQDVENGKPDAAKIDETIGALEAKYPTADVRLYLALSAEHWPDVPEMQQAWKSRSESTASS